MSVRFLFLTSSFSAGESSTDMFQQLAEELASRGHQADIISMGMDGNSTPGPLPGHLPGLRAFVLGAPPTWASSRGALKYAPNVWRLNLNRALGAWLRGPYDGFLFATPAVMSAGVGQRLQRAGIVKKTGFVLWDFFPVAQVEAGALRLGPAEGPAHRLERTIARACDVLLPMSPAGADFAREYYGLRRTPTEILPPWGRPIEALGSPSRFDRFTCVWGGQFIARRAIPDLLEAARILVEQGADVDFRLAGDGPLLDASVRQARELDLRNVHFEGRLSRERYLDLLMRSHVALSVIEPGSSPCFPSKTVDYCQAGLPLIASVEECSDYGQILSDAGAGVAVAAGDARGIADAIGWMAHTPTHEREVMSKASRRFFEEHLQVEVAAATVERIMSSAVEVSPTGPDH